MANSIGAALTRVVEGVQNAFEAMGSAFSAGFGSAWKTVTSLFAGKEKNTILTNQPSLTQFNTTHKSASVDPNFWEKHQQSTSLEARIQNLREWGDKIGMPGSAVKEESVVRQTEVSYLLSPKQSNNSSRAENK